LVVAASGSADVAKSKNRSTTIKKTPMLIVPALQQCPCLQPRAIPSFIYSVEGLIGAVLIFMVAKMMGK